MEPPRSARTPPTEGDPEGDPPACRARLRAEIPPDPEAVRGALVGLVADLAEHGVGAAEAGSFELVLAEVLNNIAEHALAAHTDGRIEISLNLSHGDIRCEVRDNGAPMPGEVLPDGARPDRGATLGDLPEGGFGWFLILSLARDVRYLRHADGNLLCFTVPLSGSAPEV